MEIKNLEKNEADVQEKIDFLKQELAQIQEQITLATENMKAIDQQIQFIDNYKIELEVLNKSAISAFPNFNSLPNTHY